MKTAEEAVADVLEHHGVKGMKWGVRRERQAVTTSQARTVTDKAKVKATGGTGQKAHGDAVKAEVVKQKIRKSGVKSASNEELQKIIERVRLEDQAKVAVASKGKKFVKKKLETQLDSQTNQFVNQTINDAKNRRRN